MNFLTQKVGNIICTNFQYFSYLQIFSREEIGLLPKSLSYLNLLAKYD